MRIILMLIVNLVIACSGPDKSGNAKEDSKTAPDTSGKSAPTVADPLNNTLPDKSTTITVSYAAIECGCPQWFETKFKDVKFLKGVERFFLEPMSKDVMNANDLWDGEHLPITLKITGKFSKEKEMPITYQTKRAVEKARIFWYDKIIVLSPSLSNK